MKTPIVKSSMVIVSSRNIITLPNSRYVAALFKRTNESKNDFGLIVYDLVDMKIVRQANLVSIRHNSNDILLLVSFTCFFFILFKLNVVPEFEWFP